MEKIIVKCPKCSVVKTIEAKELECKCGCGQIFKIRKDLNIEREIN